MKLIYWNNTITLNTLLLILVSLAGFLGTLIHIASSFTNYVGSDKFNKSWLLWYFVKPFTGAALALILYFVFRAGLLSFNDAGSINLYGIITMAALAGLFTDKATLKLEEVFTTIFQPKDTRPNKITDNDINVTITGIKPGTLMANADNELIISGQGLDKKKFVIRINDDEIKDPVIKADSISFAYKIPDASEKNEFKLSVFDEQGKEIYTSTLLKNAIAPAENIEDKDKKPAADPAAPADTQDSATAASNETEFGEPDADDENNPVVKD